MKYVYILENDGKFRDEMIEAIRKIDPQLMIRWFASLEEFSRWIRISMVEGAEALPKGGIAAAGQQETGAGPHQLVLVISKNEFLGSKHMSLLKKTQELFIKKGLCTAEDPTALVLTSFESPHFKMKEVEDSIINNVIFKPFDKLILQQHLIFAISGRHPPSSYAIHNSKTTAIIEMLKEIEIESISDVGFVTVSNRPITPGAFGKYYSDAFLSLKHKSMSAVSLRCDPHPDRKDFFRCSFSFFGADPYQISHVRKQVRHKDAKAFTYQWVPKVAANPIEIGLLCPDEEIANNFKDILANNFTNVNVHIFTNLQDFLYTVDPELAKKDKKEVDFSKLPQLTHGLNALFADQFFFEGNFKERWQGLMDTVKRNLKAPSNPSGKTELFVLSKNFYTDQQKKAFGEITKDIFFTPLDPLYFAKKIWMFYPCLRPREELQYPTVINHQIVKAGNPVEINEFSEAGLVMKYHRPITNGSFREFVLWLPHEVDLPEFLAACNFHEENKAQKGVFHNHFVFFGTTDHYLKHIRRWILQNHVHSKESA